MMWLKYWGCKVGMRNRAAKHYLIKWGYLDEHIKDLNETELIQMKILYATLKQLPDQQRDLLQEKYRVPRSSLEKGKNSLNDPTCAEIRGVNLKRYRTLRIQAETAFQEIFETVEKQYEQELQKAIEIEYRGRGKGKKALTDKI